MSTTALPSPIVCGAGPRWEPLAAVQTSRWLLSAYPNTPRFSGSAPWLVLALLRPRRLCGALAEALTLAASDKTGTLRPARQPGRLSLAHDKQRARLSARPEQRFSAATYDPAARVYVLLLGG